MKVNYKELFFSKTSDFLNIYLSNQCSRSPHTVKSYRDALTIFKRYVILNGGSLKSFTFRECTREYLLGFLEYLQKQGYERSSCNQRLAAIRSYLWYVADGDIEFQQNALAASNVPFLKESEKVKDVISKDCLKALLKAPGNSHIGIRDTTIMVILYDSAIRLSELLNLRISDVNLSKSTAYLRIHGKGDKERIVSISENTVSHIRRYLSRYHSQFATGDYLFYTVIHGSKHKMSPGNVARIINKYAEAIRPEYPDLPSKIHPHMFRRTRATDLYQNDVDLELVSRILGHSSTQTTRIYAKPSLEMLREAMSKSSIQIKDEEQLWPDDEDELARLFGLR